MLVRTGLRNLLTKRLVKPPGRLGVLEIWHHFPAKPTTSNFKIAIHPAPKMMLADRKNLGAHERKGDAMGKTHDAGHVKNPLASKKCFTV
jgi:hypothetical protein